MKKTLLRLSRSAASAVWSASGASGPGLRLCGRYLPGPLRTHGLCLWVGCAALGFLEATEVAA